MSDGEDHKDIIRRLGGKARLAEALGLERDVLTKWHVRGIPAKYWHQITALASRLDVPFEITPADLARSRPKSAETRVVA